MSTKSRNSTPLIDGASNKISLDRFPPFRFLDKIWEHSILPLTDIDLYLHLPKTYPSSGLYLYDNPSSLICINSQVHPSLHLSNPTLMICCRFAILKSLYGDRAYRRSLIQCGSLISNIIGQCQCHTSYYEDYTDREIEDY